MRRTAARSWARPLCLALVGAVAGGCSGGAGGSTRDGGAEGGDARVSGEVDAGSSGSDAAREPVDAGEPEPEPRVDNPFEGARFYVSPAYGASVSASIERAPEALRGAMERVREQPTAVWLDRIAAIEGSAESWGLRAHLDEALQQRARAGETRPMLVALVVYDLPNRDCSALASNGELSLADDGLRRYREEFIDAIAETLDADPRYRSLPVAVFLEPDSIPNLVTNTGMDRCRVAEPGYREGVAYALSRFHALPHVYTYLDIAQSGWLGWDDNVARAITVYREVLAAAGGEDRVAGFVTNISNYVPLSEPFDPFTDVGANQMLIERFYEWNRSIDELRYVARWRAAFPEHGFVIDTGRNGWALRGATSPRDARGHRGNWCNQPSGLGERPRASPEPGIHAYFWIKPPGESDGTSDTSAARFDASCGAGTLPRGAAGDVATGALQGAPEAGRWFHDHFVSLVERAEPPL